MISNFEECKKFGACSQGLEYVQKTYGDADFDIREIADYNLSWALWLVWRKDKKLCVRIKAGFARHVLHIFEKKYPNDKRIRNCINVTIAWSKGKATDAELDKAKDDAGDAGAARAAWAAGAARDAWAAVRAARAAAEDAAGDAGDAERAWQLKYFKRMMRGAV